MIGDDLEPMREQEREENKDKGKWITVKKTPVFIEEGKSVAKAIKDTFDNIDNGNPSEITVKTPKAEEFTINIAEAKKSNPNGWAVDAHSTEDYENDILITTTDGYNGVAVEPNGNIVSVFKHTKSTVKGAAKYLLAEAVKNGGDRLDAYGPVLYDIYTKYGFEPVSWIKWDDRFAPPGWTEKDQRQDIVFYKYVGVKNVFNESYEDFKNRIAVSKNYDEAQAIRDKSIGGN